MPGFVGLPRVAGLSAFGTPAKDARLEGLPMRPEAIFNPAGVPFKPQQVIGLERIRSGWAEWGSAFVKFDCGEGKTMMALAAAVGAGRVTAILCDNDARVTQWRDAILGNASLGVRGWVPGARVGELHATSYADAQAARAGTKARAKCDVEGADIWLVSLKSLVHPSCDWPADLLARVGTLIVDEAHKYTSATHVHATSRFRAARVLGMTATPNLASGLDPTLYLTQGPLVAAYQRLPHITGVWGALRVLQVRSRGCWGYTPVYLRTAEDAAAAVASAAAAGTPVSARSPDDVSDELTWRAMERLPERVALVVDTVRRLVASLCEDRWQVMVFTHLVSQVERIAAQLRTFLPEPGRVVDVHGKQSPADRAAAEFACKQPACLVQVTTYALRTEGWDHDKVVALVKDMPARTVNAAQQCTGRTERKADGKPPPLVVVLVDDEMPKAVRAAESQHRGYYTERGFTVVTISANDFRACLGTGENCDLVEQVATMAGAIVH